MEDRTTDKMWLVRHLEVIRISVVEDMKVVKVTAASLVMAFRHHGNQRENFIRKKGGN